MLKHSLPLLVSFFWVFLFFLLLYVVWKACIKGDMLCTSYRNERKTDRVDSRWKKNQAQDISDRVLALHCAIPKTIIQEDGCQIMNVQCSLRKLGNTQMPLEKKTKKSTWLGSICVCKGIMNKSVVFNSDHLKKLTEDQFDLWKTRNFMDLPHRILLF